MLDRTSASLSRRRFLAGSASALAGFALTGPAATSAAAYLDRFYTGWSASAINYSAHGTGVGIDAVRARYAGVVIGGIDETRYRTLAPETLRAQAATARTQAGARFILTPGCSVPNDASPEELRRLSGIFPS